MNALKISFNWDLSYDLDFVEDLKQIGINCNNLKPFSLITCFDLFINNDILKSMGFFVTINGLKLNFWGNPQEMNCFGEQLSVESLKNFHNLTHLKLLTIITDDKHY